MVRQRGMTLIEMLVALTILSLVITVAAEGYRYYFFSVDKRLYANNKQMSQVITRKLVNEQLKKIIPYYVKRSNSKDEHVVFFKGSSKDLIAVSSSSISGNPLYSSVIALLLQDGWLVYCEKPMTDFVLSSDVMDSSAVCDEHKIRIMQADDVKMTYHGYTALANVFKMDLETGSRDTPGMMSRSSLLKENDATQSGVLPDQIIIEVRADGISYHAFIVDVTPFDLFRVSLNSNVNY